MMTTLVAEKLAITARESLSNYCVTTCKAQCCRKGYLLLTEKEVKLMRGVHKKDLQLFPVDLTVDNKGYVFDLGAQGYGCPHLAKYQCLIHKNPQRPKACKEFPLFIWKNKTVMVTYACPAVQENKLYPYLATFKKMGYTLIYREGKERRQ